MEDLSLEVSGLTKRFGDRAAVADLTFGARHGDVVGLLGPNGAGKTTTIRLLTTVLSPTSGTFTVDGVPASEPTRIRRRVGVLAESAGFPRSHSGEEYLRYYARLFGHDRHTAAAVARRLLGEVGLADRASSQILSYSRGMRQRLGIARALVNDPAVVFLDEPTLGLDPAGQRQMLELVHRITKERGATVLLSTHLLAEVEEVCSQVVILNRGRVVAEGTVAEVARQAAAPRRARLRVAPEATARALAALSDGGKLSAAELRPGELELTFSAEADPEAMSAAALRLLLAAEVSVLGFELEGGRLSDAFLAMTESA